MTEERDPRVLEILRAKRTQVGREHGASPGVGSPTIGEKRAFPAWPEDVFVARMTVQMGAEIVNDRRRQRHRPTPGFRLWRSLD